MSRRETIRAHLLEADPDEGPVSLDFAEVEGSEVRAEDLPEGVGVEVFHETERGPVLEVTASFFSRPGGAGFEATVEHLQPRKFWHGSVLSLDLYLQVLERVVRARERSLGDVRFEELDLEDEAFPRLVYQSYAPEVTLEAAYLRIRQTERELQAEVERFEARIQEMIEQSFPELQG